jgi:hypothetical protein
VPSKSEWTFERPHVTTIFPNNAFNLRRPCGEAFGCGFQWRNVRRRSDRHEPRSLRSTFIAWHPSGG